jgi:hypothetical protein
MVSAIIFIAVIFICIVLGIIVVEYDEYIWTFLIIGLLLNLLWIIPIFTGVDVKNNEGQYKGYVIAVERNGAFFVGYNAYLKTDLTSSNEDVACIDRDNKELIEELKKAQENKENIVVEYEGVWQYKIGECPNSSFKIIRIVK